MATLLIVDPQVDFHPGGSLAIPTANEDAERIATFLCKNSSSIARVVVTMDSHLKLHIGHANFWIHGDSKDEKIHPDPFTIISHADVQKGTWKPREDFEVPTTGTILDPCIWKDDASYQAIIGDDDATINIQEYALEYTRLLEKKGRFQLCIWPEHCIIGTTGHTIVPPLQKAIDEWSAKTGRSIEVVFKGTNVLTEMYSAIEADVPIDASTALNNDLCQSLLSSCEGSKSNDSNLLLVCGQALSHCVNYTLRDLVQYFQQHTTTTTTAPITNKIILLRDCTSAVPGFEAPAEIFVQDMKSAGVKVRTSTDVFQ